MRLGLFMSIVLRDRRQFVNLFCLCIAFRARAGVSLRRLHSRGCSKNCALSHNWFKGLQTSRRLSKGGFGSNWPEC